LEHFKTFIVQEKFQLDNLFLGRAMSLRHFDWISMYILDINQQPYKHHAYTMLLFALNFVLFKQQFYEPLLRWI